MPEEGKDMAGIEQKTGQKGGELQSEWTSGRLPEFDKDQPWDRTRELLQEPKPGTKRFARAKSKIDAQARANFAKPNPLERTGR